MIAHRCCEDAWSLPSFALSLEANLNGFCSLLSEMQASSVAKRSACNSSSIEPMSLIFFLFDSSTVGHSLLKNRELPCMLLSAELSQHCKHSTYWNTFHFVITKLKEKFCKNI